MAKEKSTSLFLEPINNDSIEVKIIREALGGKMIAHAISPKEGKSDDLYLIETSKNVGEVMTVFPTHSLKGSQLEESVYLAEDVTGEPEG